MSDKPTYEEAVFPVQSPRHTAFKIAFIYASISVIWILFSDQLLSIFVKDIETITRIQMAKGWFFVLATSYLIFLLLQKDIKKYCQVEEALRHSQEQLLSLMDTMPIALAWANEQGNIQYSNNKFRELFGYPLEDMPTVEQWFQLAYPDQEYRQTVVSNWQIAVENAQNSGPEIAPIEVTIACKDGSTRYVAVVGTLIHDRILAVFNDLTESKRAENALRESEIKYRHLVEATNDWVWSCDINGIHIFSNQAAKSLLGYEPHEIIGKSAFDFIHPEDMEWVQKTVQQATNNKKGWQIDSIRWLHKDGGVRYVESRAEPILDTEGNIAGFSGIDRDVSERKKTEENLMQEKAFTETILNSLPGGFYLYDENLRLIRWNNNFEEYTGYTTEELFHKSLSDFFEGEDIERIAQAVDQVFSEGGTEIEAYVINKDGTKTPYFMTGSLFTQNNKNYILGVTFDITDRMLAEESLQKSEEMYRNLFENTGTATFIAEENMTISQINAKCEELIGYTRDEIEGKMKTPDFVSIKDIEKIKKYHFGRREQDGDYPPQYELTLIDKHGDTKNAIIQIGMIPGTKKSIASIIDITPLRKTQESLRESEERFRNMLTNIPGAVYRCENDENWAMHFISDGIEDMSGYPPSDFEQNRVRTFNSIIHPQDRPLVAEAVRKSLAHGEPFTLEYRITDCKGNVRWVYERGRVVMGREGEVEYIDGAIFDVTDRKQAEEGLRESERRYRALFESANDAIFIMKEDTFLESNPKTLEMFGCTYEQIIGKQPFKFSPPNQPDGSDSRKKAIEKIRIAFEKKSQVFEWRHTKYDGTPFDAQVSLNVVELKTGIHLQAIVRDITERKHAEQDLKKSESQLRSLAHRLQEVEEAERKALARELHDSVGQNMTALNINLNILQTQLPLELLEKVGPRLEDSMNLVDETTEHIRDVMAELRPSVLDDYGLVAALRWYGKRFSERTGVSVHLHEDETLSRLPETVESAFFRIAQEALTNVSKHADATQVALSFEEIDGMLRLVIADNGKGFDPMAVSKFGDRKGWGILNMQERAQTLGGQVQVESEPGRGTKILTEMRK
jgi:PAS domain S-box-containing protein